MSTYKLPFIPGAMNFDHMTTSLNATHPAGDAALWTEYNLHSLNGLAQSKKTAEYLKMKKPDNRTFVSSASTFAGSGKYAQHSINSLDNSWDALNYSIAGVMNFNMFGVPLVGADACFGTSELCQRWVQLATFFPFARLNVENITTPQLNAFKIENAMWNRLQYARHMYTCLAYATMGGQTCFDPLLMHYPNDKNVFEQTENSFIVGDAIKVSPVLEEGATKFMSYFPAGSWVSLNSFDQIINSQDGEWVELTAPDDMVHAHLRPGYMIPK